MKAVLILLMCWPGILFLGYEKEFVCLPCGSECDNQIYAKEGSCSSCSMKLVEKSTIRFSNISVNQLCNRIGSNPKAILLDVRSAGEFAGSTTEVSTFGHFKNAININVTELEKRAGELAKYKEDEILVYCSHAHRSAVASYFLTTHGFKNVKNMTGGVSSIDPSDNDCLKKSYVTHKH